MTFVQREKLQEEFTRALNKFQGVQREAAEREREGLEVGDQGGQGEQEDRVGQENLEEEHLPLSNRAI